MKLEVKPHRNGYLVTSAPPGINHGGMCQKLQTNDVNAVIRLESSGVRWHCSTCRIKIVVNSPRTTEAKNSATLIKLNNIEEMRRSSLKPMLKLQKPTLSESRTSKLLVIQL